MARPNRNSKEGWFDLFADFPIDEQAAALRILEQVHRLAVRESKRNSKQPEQHFILEPDATGSSSGK